MRNRAVVVSLAGLLMATAAAFAQAPASKLVFDVASVRPSPAPDMQKMMMDLQAGKSRSRCTSKARALRSSICQ